MNDCECGEHTNDCRCAEPCPRCGHECDCTLPPAAVPPPDEADVAHALLCEWGGGKRATLTTEAAPCSSD